MQCNIYISDNTNINGILESSLYSYAFAYNLFTIF